MIKQNPPCVTGKKTVSGINKRQGRISTLAANPQPCKAGFCQAVLQAGCLLGQMMLTFPSVWTGKLWNREIVDTAFSNIVADLCPISSLEI